MNRLLSVTSVGVKPTFDLHCWSYKKLLGMCFFASLGMDVSLQLLVLRLVKQRMADASEPIYKVEILKLVPYCESNPGNLRVADAYSKGPGK